MDRLNRAKVVITNFHAFLPRETVKAGTLTKKLLAGRGSPRAAAASPFTETPDQMVRRVLPRVRQQAQHRRHQRRGAPLLPRQAGGERGGRRRRSGSEAPSRRAKPHRRGAQGGQAPRRRGARLDQRPRGDQAQDRHPGHLRPLGHAVLPARLGLLGGHALPVGGERLLAGRRHRVRHRQGAACAGGRQLDDRRDPQVPAPVAAREGRLPKKGRSTEEIAGMPKLPKELEAALETLYGNYEKYYDAWTQRRRGARRGQPPHAAGVHRRLQQHQRLQAGLRLDRGLGANGGRGRGRAQRHRARQAARCSATSSTGSGWTGPTRSSSTRRSSSPARR